MRDNKKRASKDMTSADRKGLKRLHGIGGRQWKRRFKAMNRRARGLYVVGTKNVGLAGLPNE